MSWALRDVSARVSTRRHAFVSPRLRSWFAPLLGARSNCSPYKNTTPLIVRFKMAIFLGDLLTLPHQLHQPILCVLHYSSQIMVVQWLRGVYRIHCGERVSDLWC
jgi:hypothetical protein